MTDLVQLKEKDLKETLEREWGSPVTLIGPDGAEYDTANDGEPLKGQVLGNSVQTDPSNGFPVIGNNPVVTLRISNLPVVPKSGEKWSVKMALAPVENAPKITYFAQKAFQTNHALGTIMIKLTKTKQL